MPRWCSAVDLHCGLRQSSSLGSTQSVSLDDQRMSTLVT